MATIKPTVGNVFIKEQQRTKNEEAFYKSLRYNL